MAIVKDWIAEAANRIVDELHGDYAGTRDEFVQDFTLIIEQCCPMKPDIAYMPVPRCETCAHWVAPISEMNLGVCWLPDVESIIEIDAWDDGGNLMTRADFGCVQWKEKT